MVMCQNIQSRKFDLVFQVRKFEVGSRVSATADAIVRSQNEVVEPSFRTLRKCAEACQTDLLNFDWNQIIEMAGISGFT